MLKVKGAIVLSLFGFILNACHPLNYDQIKQELKSNDAIIIDVREDYEVKEGKLEQAVHIPLGLIETPEHLAKVKEMAKEKKVYIYCRSGARSQRAVNTLKKHGVNAVNAGGYEDLSKKGL